MRTAARAVRSSSGANPHATVKGLKIKRIARIDLAGMRCQKLRVALPAGFSRVLDEKH
jgi:hypothetical protein